MGVGSRVSRWDGNCAPITHLGGHVYSEGIEEGLLADSVARPAERRSSGGRHAVHSPRDVFEPLGPVVDRIEGGHVGQQCWAAAGGSDR